MDALMDHAQAVQAAVAAQLRPLLDTQLSVVFYDLTTIRIHGTGAVHGDVRAFGRNKQTGGIARQFVLGVIQTAEGLPIAHRVHEGNVGEVCTLVPMIKDTLQRYRIAKVVLVADRALLSLDNVEAIEALRTPAGKPLQYVLAVPGRRYAELPSWCTPYSCKMAWGIPSGRAGAWWLPTMASAPRSSMSAAARRSPV